MVSTIKNANAGSKTMSKYPVKEASPTAPNKITRIGVKQHKATIMVPIIPNWINNLSLSIIKIHLLNVDG